jgi:hypothetical protein
MLILPHEVKCISLSPHNFLFAVAILLSFLTLSLFIRFQKETLPSLSSVHIHFDLKLELNLHVPQLELYHYMYLS